jgi:hypothetical protein
MFGCEMACANIATVSDNRCVIATVSDNRCVIATVSDNRCVIATVSDNLFVIAAVSDNRCVKSHVASVLRTPTNVGYCLFPSLSLSLSLSFSLLIPIPLSLFISQTGLQSVTALRTTDAALVTTAVLPKVSPHT